MKMPSSQKISTHAAYWLAAFVQAANAEVPFDPPGSYSSSWLGNTYMDANGHKNVTEELSDMCVSANDKLFTAGYAET